MVHRALGCAVVPLWILFSLACAPEQAPQASPTPSTEPSATSAGTQPPLTTPQETPTATAVASKPPVEASALADDYREPLAAIGLVLTSRGGLIDRSNGGYVKSASGDHLALYLEPPGERTTEAYVDGIVASARVFIPGVFERWPSLASFDVCQEPVGIARPGASEVEQEPPPVSQIEVSRTQAAAIDWDTVTLDALVDGAAADPPRLGLIVSDELKDSEGYREATG